MNEGSQVAPMNLKQRAATEIVRSLRAAGHQAYFAGGCVRDLLLNRPALDFDVATSALPETVLEVFPRTFAVGAHFGVILVALDLDGEEIVTEVATFRHDGAYSDGRHPDAVRFSHSPEEDVQRRDFTINGLLLDPERFDLSDPESAVLDFVGGIADVHTGIIRAIGDPARRFTEDKLRMLRAVRFAARLGFTIEPETFAAIRTQAAEIHQVSAERIRDELTRMFTEGRAHIALDLLDSSGLLAETLPEITRMHGVEQPPQFHPEGDVYIHTRLLMEQLPPNPSATLAWGALLHDVGKPATFRRAPDRIRFDGHVEVGVRIAADILRRLRFSNEDTAQILALVENHMRFADIRQMRESTLKRFLRLPAFDEHLALHRLDCLSCHRDLSLYRFAKERFETVPAEAVRPTLLVTGRDLIAAGYRPGPEFKRLLTLAEDAQLEGRIHSTGEGLALIRSQQNS